MSTSIYFISFIFTVNFVTADDRIYFNAENEKRRNTPPELTPEASSALKIENQDAPQSRFLPFTASFSLNSGTSNSHSSSIAGKNDGISLSQSQSTSSSSFGNIGATGLSSSHSSSFSAGLSGISASNVNAFSLNYPAFNGNSGVDANAFAFGQASSSSAGKIDKNHVSTSAQSGVGSWNSGAAGETLSGQNDRQGKPSWTNLSPNYNSGGVYQRPSGHTRPLRLDIDVDDSRFQQSHPTVLVSDWQPPSRRNHKILFNKFPNRGQRYPIRKELDNSQSPSVVRFPGEENHQNIPREFVRSKTRNLENPVDEFFSDITDTVADLLDL